MKLELNLETVKRVGRRLAQSVPLITLLAIAALMMFTAWQIRLVLNLEPNAKLIAEEQSKAEKDRVRFDLVTLNAISGLNQVQGKSDLSNVGKSDPFSP